MNARAGAADDGQYSLRRVLLIWAAGSLPMGVLAWGVWPALRGHLPWHTGVTFWLLMIVGMVWQCVLSLLILRQELGTLRWSVLAPRIWAQTPRDPATGVARRRLWWWVLPAILGVGLFADALGGIIDAPMGWLGLAAPANTEVVDLATDAFVGAWWLLPIALVSSVFNYLLGEELLWRGVLLPKMRGTFGRWDWLANALLFTFYHLHKPWTWPSSFIGNALIAYPTRRFRSIWLAVVIHGVEGLVMLALVTGVVLGVGID